MIPKYEALDIVDLWVRENRFNEHLAIIPPDTVVRSTQTEKIPGKSVATITNEVNTKTIFQQTEELFGVKVKTTSAQTDDGYESRRNVYLQDLEQRVASRTSI